MQAVAKMDVTAIFIENYLIIMGCSNIVQIQTESALHSHGNILRVCMNERMSMLILILCVVLGDVRHNMKTSTSLLCLDLFVISLFVM